MSNHDLLVLVIVVVLIFAIFGGRHWGGWGWAPTPLLVVALIVLLFLFYGCGSSSQQLVEPIKEFFKPVTEWIDDPEAQASFGVSFQDQKFTFTGGIDLGWIRAGVSGGCLVAPIKFCWEWP